MYLLFFLACKHIQNNTNSIINNINYRGLIVLLLNNLYQNNIKSIRR